MRHRNKVKKLGRTASHRKATYRNMTTSLLENRQIRTTLHKAKALCSHVDRLITIGKQNTVHARRLAFKQLQNRDIVKVLFDEIAPQFEGRNGGYTRVIKLGQRRGDGAEMAVLQLVGFEQLIVDDGPARKKSRKPSSSRPAKKAAGGAPVAAVAAAAKEAVADQVEEANEIADAAAEQAEAASAAVEETTADSATDDAAAKKDGGDEKDAAAKKDGGDEKK